EFPDVHTFDLKSVKACVSGAAPLPQAVAKRFAEVSDGAVLVEGYGLTECSPVTHVNPLDGRGRPGSIGMPIPDTDVRIISLDDPTGERVKAIVVLKEGRQLTAEELIAWAKDPAQGLTGYRVPKEIEFRDTLPETLVGKVLRRVLQDEERTKREAATAAP